MDLLNTSESVLNCPICRNSHLRTQRIFPKQYIKEFSRGMYQFWQHKYKPVSREQSREILKKTKTTCQKYKELHRDGYEQIHRKLMKEKEQKKSDYKITKHQHHTKKTPIIYQVYTLTTDNNDNKLRRKSSRTVYSYPYSSSSDTSTSLLDRERKRSVTMHPSVKKGLDEDDTDSEFDSCHKFPITEKHYRHICDGIECTSQYRSPPYSKSKPKPKQDREQSKTTKRANIDFNQINFKQLNGSNNPYNCVLKAKKKCNCKHKCKPNSEEDDTRSTCSELSEKTFAKFINSLHSYVSKAKRQKQSNLRKKQTRRLDTDSSCSLCAHEEKYVKKKKPSREHHHVTRKPSSHHHHHHHRHHKSNNRPDNEDLSFLHK